MTTSTKPFVPDVELTAGQPAPIAANGGKAYTSRDVNGDAGTAAAVSDALEQIASGEGQAVTDFIENAAPGPIETPWGKGFDAMPNASNTLNPATCRRRKAALLCHCITQSLTPLPTLWCRLTQSGRTRSERRKRPNSRRTNATTRAAASTSRTDHARRPAHPRVLPGFVAKLSRVHGQTGALLGLLRIPVPEFL